MVAVLALIHRKLKQNAIRTWEWNLSLQRDKRNQALHAKIRERCLHVQVGTERQFCRDCECMEQGRGTCYNACRPTSRADVVRTDVAQKMAPVMKKDGRVNDGMWGSAKRRNSPSRQKMRSIGT